MTMDPPSSSTGNIPAAPGSGFLSKTKHASAQLVSSPRPSRNPQALSIAPQLQNVPKSKRPRPSIETLQANIAQTKEELDLRIQEINRLDSCTTRQSKPDVSHGADTGDKAALAHANALVDEHITLLKQYNRIKDIALGMLGIIAEKEGKRLAEVMEERGVKESD
jgi:hypothetical protein